MIKYADVIVDLQAGDTGKGKVAHALAKDYDLVLRYNGGANAGHTIYHNGIKIVTHQVPVGIFYGIPSIIGPGCVVNLPKLHEELSMLRTLGFSGPLYIDHRVHVTSAEHIEEDSKDSKIGTTRQGIGPTYRDKYARVGKRILDVIKYSDAQQLYSVVDLYQLLHRDTKEYKILCEGAQGFQIDIDWGDYPYVTSSHCTTGAVCLNGIPPQKIRKVYGIMKAYETYSGFKSHFETGNDVDLEKIQEVGGEFGATTGRKRKVRWLNLNDTIKAANINGITDLIVNKIDILDEVGVYKISWYNQLLKLNKIEFIEFTEREFRKVFSYLNIVWSTTPNGI